MNKEKFYVETFGCQMNVNDSEKVIGLLQQAGFEKASTSEAADFVFLNTCAVRERAADKLYHALGRLRRRQKKKPSLRIGVGGCVAQLEGEAILKRVPEVDVLVGTHTFDRVPDLLRRVLEGEGRQRNLDRKADTFAVSSEVVAHSSQVRAFVTVMEGCNHVCSFCVVPRTRGPEVNRPPDQVVAEVESLVERGFPEVMLLGQTIDAYRYGEVTFADLLRRVGAIEGLQRLRFTTSHPTHVDAALADTFTEVATLCPYLHLPVQSGSDRILKSMRRGYTAGEYEGKVRLLRSRRADLALSSDVIVGYPGETEDDFQATIDLVSRLELDTLFAFMYSPRPGTTAFQLADDVPLEEKRRRLAVLNAHQQRRQASANRGRIGSRHPRLVDAVEETQGWLRGRTPHFRIVHFDGPPEWLGRLVEVEIIGGGPNSLVGRPTIPPNDSLTQVSAVPIF